MCQYKEHSSGKQHRHFAITIYLLVLITTVIALNASCTINYNYAYIYICWVYNRTLTLQKDIDSWLPIPESTPAAGDF